jgi:Protein of unknown function (DUF3489)
MGWQKHTTRALLSAAGSLTKNHGLTIISEKVGDRRTYSIKAWTHWKIAFPCRRIHHPAAFFVLLLNQDVLSDWLPGRPVTIFPCKAVVSKKNTPASPFPSSGSGRICAAVMVTENFPECRGSMARCGALSMARGGAWWLGVVNNTIVISRRSLTRSYYPRVWRCGTTKINTLAGSEKYGWGTPLTLEVY